LTRMALLRTLRPYYFMCTHNLLQKGGDWN